MSLDVVGYSRMMSASPTQAVGLIRLLRGYIRSHAASTRGRVAGSAGDGYLVEFDGAADSTQFALDLQYALKHRNDTVAEPDRLTLRAGIDCGEILDDEGQIHGDCVNVAVRLQEAAPSGGILLSERVRNLHHPVPDLRYESLGRLYFKNVASPIDVFSVQRVDEPLSLSSIEQRQSDLLMDVPGFEHGLSIAVIPFDNRDSDPEIDHVCAGIKDELVLYIARTRFLPVVDTRAESIPAAISGDGVELGRLLNVRYLATGSVARHGSGYRISARLIDAGDGHIVWSEKYSATPDTVSQTVDDIVLRIAGTLGPQVARNEEARARSKRVSRASTTDLIWRGRWHMNRLTKEDSIEAERLFTSVLDIDSHHPEALIQLGYLRWIGTWVKRKSEPEIREIERLAYRALNASGNDARGHFLVGATNILLRDIDSAISHLEEAIHLNPSLAQAYAQLGSCQMLSGRPKKAVPLLELSLRLNPLDYYVFYVLGELSASHCMLENWEESIKNSRKSISYRPFYWHARMSEINAAARSGHMEEAARSLDTLYARRPDFSRSYIDWLPFVERRWVDYFWEGIEMVLDWKSGGA